MESNLLKIELFVNFLYPGIILHGEGFSEKGEKVIEKGSLITKELIDSLKAKGIKIITYTRESLRYKYDNSSQMISDTHFERAVHIMNDVEGCIRNKAYNLPKKHIDDLVNGFVKDIKENEDSYLNLLELYHLNDYTFTHSINVSTLSLLLGTSLNMSDEKLNIIGVAGLLHDMGKAMIPQEIIDKPAELNCDEWALMRSHPVYGYNIIQAEKAFHQAVGKTILCHHENYAGGGYPFGLNHEKLDPLSQIVSISDVFDASTSKKPYKDAHPIDNAFCQIMEQTGVKFDPKVSQIFLMNLAKKIKEEPVYPEKCFVLLNTGEIGYVVGHRSSPYTIRPIVNIFYNSNREGDMAQKFLKFHQQIDLELDYNRYVIKRVMDQNLIEKFIQILNLDK